MAYAHPNHDPQPVIVTAGHDPELEEQLYSTYVMLLALLEENRPWYTHVLQEDPSPLSGTRPEFSCVDPLPGCR